MASCSATPVQIHPAHPFPSWKSGWCRISSVSALSLNLWSRSSNISRKTTNHVMKWWNPMESVWHGLHRLSWKKQSTGKKDTANAEVRLEGAADVRLRKQRAVSWQEVRAVPCGWTAKGGGGSVQRAGCWHGHHLVVQTCGLMWYRKDFILRALESR